MINKYIKTPLKTALMIIAIIGIIVIAGSMIYYFVIFRPGIEKAELKLQEQKAEADKKDTEQKATEEATRKENLEKCLKEADDWWKTFTASKGMTDEQVALVWKMYQDKIDNCYKQYGE